MSDQDTVLAVIIGRAGSKGLPGKNALLLNGRPMICYSIEHAQQAASVDRVLVSTDGPAIADAAAAMGIDVIHRPPALADDHATVDAAVRHAVKESGDESQWIVILYANVPIRPVGLIDRAVAMLRETGCDSVQSYCEVGKHHPYWMVTLDDHNRVVPHVRNTVYRRQDLPPLRLPDGGVLAVNRQSLFTERAGEPHAFLGTDRRGIEVPAGEVIDIDSTLDLAVAQAIIDQVSG